MENYIIDVETHDANAMYHRINNLVSTGYCEKPDKYHFGPSQGVTGYSRICFSSTRTLIEIDDWLYESVSLDYVGAVESKF